ncbi:MAG: hypoxanthine phosphoribosyltransferase [Anaerorhabdus sp.]
MHSMLKEILVSEKDIVSRSKELGLMITKDYKDSGSTPLLVALLKGSVPFLAELIKHIELDITLDFMDVSSYEGTESLGDIKILKDLDSSIRGLDILLVEDIVDTGKTLVTVKELLFRKGAKSVKIVSLLNKQSRRTEEVDVDYIGFEVRDEFVVGFGLDYNEMFRNLPYVGVLKDECYQ